MKGAWVRTQVGELRSHMLWGTAKKLKHKIFDTQSSSEISKQPNKGLRTQVTQRIPAGGQSSQGQGAHKLRVAGTQPQGRSQGQAWVVMGLARVRSGFTNVWRTRICQKGMGGRDDSRSLILQTGTHHRQKSCLRIQGRGLMSRRDGGRDQKNITDFSQVTGTVFQVSLIRKGWGQNSTDVGKDTWTQIGTNCVGLRKPNSRPEKAGGGESGRKTFPGGDNLWECPCLRIEKDIYYSNYPETYHWGHTQFH